MRSAIVLLLFGAAAIGGCDRQSAASQQANDTVAATPKPGGRLDRGHKGEIAPETAFIDPKGARVTLAAFRGKPVLLNLWATWCAPCVKEMPTLDALAATKGDTINVVALSQDFDTKKVAPFFRQANFKRLQPYLDTDATFSTGMALNLPTTILYDSQGREVWRMSGDFEWNGAEAAKLIAEAG